MNREEAVLREFNLYPLWQRRVQLVPDGTASHLTDELTGHSSTLSKDASQVAGYKPQKLQSVSGYVETGVPAVPVAVAAIAATATVADETPVAHALGQGKIADLDWAQLKARVRDCTACKLRAGCTQTVFGVGDEKAGWLFVGEGPGADEDAQGEPFVGQAGKLLDNMLMAIKLKRGKDVYIGNIVKCRPPGNRTPEADEIATCLPYLQRQIELIQPKIIVALGKTAATALLSKDATLASLRGRLHDYHGIPLIITYHPAYLLRTPADKAKAWQDLCLAIKTRGD